MKKLTITAYTDRGGQYVKEEKEIEAEFVTRKEALKRRLHIVHARTGFEGSNLIVYQDDGGAYFYNTEYRGKP